MLMNFRPTYSLVIFWYRTSNWVSITEELDGPDNHARWAWMCPLLCDTIPTPMAGIMQCLGFRVCCVLWGLRVSRVWWRFRRLSSVWWGFSVSRLLRVKVRARCQLFWNLPQGFFGVWLGCRPLLLPPMAPILPWWGFRVSRVLWGFRVSRLSGSGSVLIVVKPQLWV